ncbi:AzlD domain-containing protein [uncultured Roseibium sp.]|uniref:AzlD domain-containing protein n=1 Tax=uncultured Roseibium sp. TaxID=1936171 RepID=UPI002636CB0E|nr:AzlD domain-containing protein [uncultured Roseibium sp.]
MMDDWSYALVVLILAAAAFATRIAGAVLMSFVTLTPKTERFLEGLSVSVIAALVASNLVTADFRTMTATLLAVAVMALSQSVIWAMFAGMTAAAAFPFVFTP